MARKHWSKLPGVRGFTRVPDEVFPDGTYRRMLRCDACGQIIPSLGVGYHKGGGQRNARACTDRPPRKPQKGDVFIPAPSPGKLSAPVTAMPPAMAPAPVASDPYAISRDRPRRIRRVADLSGGQVVEAIQPGDGQDWLTPLGFPARLQAVLDNRDGSYSLVLITDHWDKRRHLPGNWKVRVGFESS